MILVRIEHFLNVEGRHYFPHWLQHVAKRLREQPGFQGIRRLKGVQGGEECVWLLEFENLGQLEHWLNSEDYAEALSLLESYTLKPPSLSQYYFEHVVV